MKYILVLDGGTVYVSIACDFAAIMRYMIAQSDANVTGFLSYDLKATTEMVKSLGFGQGDLGERQYVL